MLSSIIPFRLNALFNCSMWVRLSSANTSRPPILVAVLFTGDVYIAQLIEVAFYASWALGMVFSLVLSEVRKWPAGPILVLNIGLSGVGSFIVAVALFVSAPSLPSPGSTLIVLFIGYSLIGFSLMSCFSVTFGVIGVRFKHKEAVPFIGERLIIF